MVLPAGSKLLYEFKAGKMRYDGKLLKPDSRKGVVRILRTEDGLMHMMWYERTDAGSKADPEDDVIVFPEEAKFEKVPSQRVLLLKFPEEKDRSMFFWLQEPDAARDEEVRAAADKAINTMPGLDLEDEHSDDEVLPDVALVDVARDALERGTRSDAPGAGLELAQGSSVGDIASAPGQNPEFNPEYGAVGSAPSGQLQASALAQLLSVMAGGPSHQQQRQALDPALLAGLAALQRQQRQAPGPGLQELLRPEALLPLLSDPDMLARLAPHLPEQHRSRDALLALAHSPQFQQQVQVFGQALQSGQLDLSQFGLQAAGFSVADFLIAIQDLVEREQQGSGQGQGQEGQGQQ